MAGSVKQASRKELGDLGVVYVKLFELTKNGVRPAGAVIAGMQQLADGLFPENLRFSRYDHNLLNLEVQLHRLRHYNATYWDNYLTEEQLAAVDTTSDHEQRVDDLEHFHVQFSSDVETAEMWWRVFVGEQPDSWRWPSIQLDPEHFKLLDHNVRTYEPGIYRIRTDLVANWEPTDCRTLEEVQQQVKEGDETLAHLEVMSVYGIHVELFREQDGENLPFPDMAGTVLTVPVDARPHALCVFWGPIRRGAFLGASPVVSRAQRWSAPVVGESVALGS